MSNFDLSDGQSDAFFDEPSGILNRASHQDLVRGENDGTFSNSHDPFLGSSSSQRLPVKI